MMPAARGLNPDEARRRQARAKECHERMNLGPEAPGAPELRFRSVWTICRMAEEAAAGPSVIQRRTPHAPSSAVVPLANSLKSPA